MEVPQGWGSTECDEAATEICECIDAHRYTRKKRRKEKAAEAIEKQFGVEAGENQIKEEIKILLVDISDKVVEGQINSGTIDIGKGIKAKIGITAKGFVKVERTRTEKETREA